MKKKLYQWLGKFSYAHLSVLLGIGQIAVAIHAGYSGHWYISGVATGLVFFYWLAWVTEKSEFLSDEIIKVQGELIENQGEIIDDQQAIIALQSEHINRANR